MTKNPILNALAAALYIAAISLFMAWGTHNAPPEDTIFAPMAVISLFTLSAAVMAYLFAYQPFVLYFDNHQKSAVKLFLQTVGVFGMFTLLMLGFLFFLG